MDYKNIEELLNKYWQAETSIEEEEKLKSFFCYSIVPAHLEKYKPLFGHLNEQSRDENNVELDEEFDEEMLNMLANKKTGSWWSKYNQPFKIAASLALVFLIGWGVYTNRPEAVDQSKSITYDDPEIAYQETKKALMLMSINLNRGTTHASQSLSKMDSAQNVIKEKN